MLWFSGPPVDLARARPPQHSLAYLNFLASKRKTQTAVNGTSEHEPAAKKQRLVPVSQRAQETWQKMQAEGSLSTFAL